jgi:hypothetical protein
MKAILEEKGKVVEEKGSKNKIPVFGILKRNGKTKIKIYRLMLLFLAL